MVGGAGMPPAIGPLTGVRPPFWRVARSLLFTMMKDFFTPRHKKIAGIRNDLVPPAG